MTMGDLHCSRCRKREATHTVLLIRDGDLGPEARELCDPCASFVDAAIAGRPCFSRGVSVGVETFVSDADERDTEPPPPSFVEEAHDG